MRLRGHQLDGFNAALKSGDAAKAHQELQTACARAEGIVPFASASLLAAVADEVEALEKEIELMKLRVSECTDSATEQTLRNFGSCLWRHKNALVKAIAANESSSATAGKAGVEREGES